MPCDFEYDFEEVGLIPDEAEPTRAVGFFSGVAEIHIEGDGWYVSGFYCTNSARKAKGFVWIGEDNAKPIFDMLAAGLRFECDESIRDRINDHHDEARDAA